MRTTRRNLYTAGIVIGAEGGAFVVAEKRPRATGPTTTSSRRSGRATNGWEDVIAIVEAERLTGRLTDMLDTAAEYLAHPPLAGDCVAFVETALLGETLGRLLADRDAGVGRIVLAGAEREHCDTATGTWSVPVAALQARVTLLSETNRLLTVDELASGSAILRSLERLDALPASGSWRDLALAAAIAVWAAEMSPTDGPWASAKEPPADSSESLHFEEQAALRALEQEARGSRRRGRRWRAFVEGRIPED